MKLVFVPQTDLEDIIDADRGSMKKNICQHALDIKVEHAIGRSHEAEAQFETAMEHINDLQRDLREFATRIDAAHVALTDFLAKQKMEK